MLKKCQTKDKIKLDEIEITCGYCGCIQCAIVYMDSRKSEIPCVACDAPISITPTVKMQCVA